MRRQLTVLIYVGGGSRVLLAGFISDFLDSFIDRRDHDLWNLFRSHKRRHEGLLHQVFGDRVKPILGQQLDKLIFVFEDQSPKTFQWRKAFE